MRMARELPLLRSRASPTTARRCDSAKVVLTNAVAGDALRIGNSNDTSGNLGNGSSYQVDNSLAGQITMK